MQKIILYTILLFCSLAIGQISPQSKDITKKFFPDIDSLSNSTPALKKDKGFTNYDELIVFLENLVTQYPSKISLQYIGESQKGLKIPMVVLKSEAAKNPIKVWMQGGLHGDEPASTEGLLYLMNALLKEKKYSYLFDKIELAIVPMANIDGYLKLDRFAANGLDLNRDQTKLMAVETIVLKKALNNFNPQVALDFHEYRPYRKDFTKFGDFGVSGSYDVMFLYSGNLNVPENIRTFTQDYFVNNAKKKLDSYQLKHHDYFTTNTYNGAIQFDLGSVSARSSATSFALQNRISTLIEVRGVGINRTSFKRRIFIAYCIGLSYLETACKEVEKVKTEISNANKQNNDVVVTSKKAIYKDTLDFIDLHSNELIPLEVTLRNAMKSKPDLIRKRPMGYIMEASQFELAEKLKALGYQVKTLDETAMYKIETYKIIQYKLDTEKYEKMNLQEVQTTLSEESKMFPQGTFYIDLNQNGSSLITEILEPEAANSFVSFGVLKTGMNEILPIYRHIH
jgi:Zinc carboxypeptidase